MAGFSRPLLAAIASEKIIGVRAGPPSAHRVIGIWAVVVDGRVFARSWKLKRDGWYRTFLENPLGAITVGTREIKVRARRVTSERLRTAVDEAYAAKYTTPGALAYVRGFKRKRRREATIEFLPR